MKNVVWLLMNTQKWAEPLPRTPEERSRQNKEEGSDIR